MAENATKCSAADGVTQTFDFCHGTPLMVRAVDFNALHAECQKLRKDAERYRWLKERLLGADFDWGGAQVLVFEMPAGFSVSADADATIDDAMAEAAAVG